MIIFLNISKLAVYLIVIMSKINTLQSIRCFAILGVITSHCDLGGFGAFSVSLFIILSGFVMFYNYQTRKINTGIIPSLKFTIGKIKKLYPLHLLTMTLILLLALNQLIKHFSSSSLISLIFKTFSNILLIQDWFPKISIYYSLNGVAWYLSLCLFLYYIFPTILIMLRQYSFIQAVNTIGLLFLIQITISFSLKYILVTSSLFDNFILWFTYILPITRALDFLIGCCTCIIFCKVKDYFRQERTFMNSIVYTAFEIVVIIIGIYVYQYFYIERKTIFGSESFVYTTIYTPCSVLLIFLFAINKGLLSTILTNKLTIWIGDLSAYLFLIHFPVITFYNIVTSKLDLKLSYLIKFVIIMTVSILLSIAYKKLEYKFLKYKN